MVSVLARGFWWACGCCGRQIALELRFSHNLKGLSLRELPNTEKRIRERVRVGGSEEGLVEKALTCWEFKKVKQISAIVE